MSSIVNSLKIPSRQESDSNNRNHSRIAISTSSFLRKTTSSRVPISQPTTDVSRDVTISARQATPHTHTHTARWTQQLLKFWKLPIPHTDEVATALRECRHMQHPYLHGAEILKLVSSWGGRKRQSAKLIMFINDCTSMEINQLHFELQWLLKPYMA